MELPNKERSDCGTEKASQGFTRAGFLVVVAIILVLAATYTWLQGARSAIRAPSLPRLAATSGHNVPRASGGGRTGRQAAASSLSGQGIPLGNQHGPTAVPASAAPGRALTEPPRKRPWDKAFLSSLKRAAEGDSIRFELVNRQWAFGTIRYLERGGGEVIHVAGSLMAPEPGQFFFQKQSVPGVAGDFVGVVEFPGSRQAYRIEPTGPGRSSELVERPLGAVRCLKLPRPARTAAQPTQEIPPLYPGNYPNLPSPAYQNGIETFESLHGATPVIYLDFQGGYTPTWGGITYQRPQVSNAQIREVWQRVAEDFMPFNINVTTDLKVFQNAPQGARAHVIITPTVTAEPDAGGVAYDGSFNWTGDIPCWVFETSGKPCAEACSHECGHTLGLSHMGQAINGVLNEYYAGQGGGETGWAPIMGVGYYQNVTEWCNGQYPNANNLEDELARISTNNNQVAFRSVPASGSVAAPRYLEVYPDGSAGAEGVMVHQDGADAFQFTTGGGALALQANPAGVGPDLALSVALYDTNNNLLTLQIPQNTLGASLATNLPPGSYLLKVAATGRGDPMAGGFSSYGSLGYYSITGNVANARLPNRFSVVEHSTNGTLVGTLPVQNPANDPPAFVIVSGNTSNTFAIDGFGTLTVANNQLLDYAAMAAQTQLTVQFELFVNILDLANPSLGENNRRVVIALLPLPPAITQQPASSTVPGGSDALFSITAVSDDPLSDFTYSWFFDGMPIAGATNSTLLVQDAQNAEAGDYTATLAGPQGTVTSAVAVLSVTPSAPWFTFQPASQVVSAGLGARLSGSAEGTAPLSFQWLFNGTNIVGETGGDLLLDRVQPSDAGAYQLVASNPVGTAVSSNAVLTVLSVLAWGWDAYGQTNVPLDLVNPIQVSGGSKHSLALDADGTVHAWGAPDQTNVPLGLTNVIAVSAGGSESLALTSNGSVVAWGDNSAGQTNVPSGLGTVIAIAAGGSHCLALTADGSVRAWGSDSSGQTDVPSLASANIVALAAGENHSLALRSDGRVVAWGDPTSGQTEVPAKLVDVVAIAGGLSHSLALRKDGTVVAWGANNYGQSTVPPGLSNVIAIAAGQYNSLALKSDGTLAAWGVGTNLTSTFPVCGESIVPAGLGGISAIAAGAAHTLALYGDGPPVITQPPVSRIAFSPRVSFRAAATGTLPLRYQWQFDDADLPGATNQVLALDVAEPGEYRLVVSNTLGATTSREAVLGFINLPPLAIFYPPQAIAEPAGSNAVFAVTASSNDPLDVLQYQWLFNGTAIPGATNSSLSLVDVQQTDAGNYSVEVSSLLGANVSSAAAALSVAPAIPLLTRQPAPLPVFPGFGASFRAAALGTEPIAYQWQFNGATIPGATGQELDITNVQHAQAGTYQVVVSNSAGVVTSSSAILALVPVLAWGADDSGQTDTPIEATNVAQIAAGGHFNLALRRDGTVVAWGASLPSQTPPGLAGVVAVAGGGAHALALKSDGTVTAWGDDSDGQTDLPPGLTNVVAVAAGESHSLALLGDGSVVAWGLDSNGQADVPLLAQYDVVAIAAGGNLSLAVRADGRVVTWGDAVGPSDVPAGLTNIVAVAAGAEHALALASDGTVLSWGDATYGQSFVPAGLSNVVAIAAGSFHSLALRQDGTLAGWGAGTVANGAYPDLGQLLPPLNMTNLAAVSAGAAHTLVLAGDGPPFITVQPANRLAYSHSKVLLRAAATGALPLSYQWQLSGGDLPGATSPVLVQADVGDAQSGAYCVVVSNAFGVTTSATASLAVLDQSAIVVIELPQNLTVSAGSNAVFAVSASSVDPLYSVGFQWLFNGTEILGATNSSLALTDVQASNAGDYAVRLTNPLSTVTSPTAALIVTPTLPTVIAQPSALALFPGSQASFRVAAIGTEPFTYQWQFNGANLAGATEQELTLTGVLSVDEGDYRVVIANPVGAVTSVAAALRVVPVATWGWDSAGQTNQPLDLADTVQVAAGATHTLALQRDGTVVAWGESNASQVPAGLAGVVAIAAGDGFSLALEGDGTVAAWGEDEFGQIVLPADLTNAVAIAAGGYHSLALRADGTVVSWGTNASQLTVPPGLSNVVAIAAGFNHCLALRADGSVVAWLSNAYGQTTVPAGLANVVAIAAGIQHSLALKSDGTVVAWGGGAYGQAAVPPGLSNVIAIAAGGYHSLALRRDGTVVAWGAGESTGPLYPLFGQAIVPANVTNIVALSAGEGHTVVLEGQGAPFIAQQPVNRSAYAGSRTAFLAAATGALPLSYQWQLDGANLVGATNPVLAIADLEGAGAYRVVVTNSLGAATSAAAMLTLVQHPPFILVQPAGQTNRVGGQVSLQVQAGGSPPLSFQWRCNGEDVPGATNATLILNSLGWDQAGAYSVVVSNAFGAISSAKASITAVQVVAWGDNAYGETNVPPGLTGAVCLAGGMYHGLALKTDGTVVAWGAGLGTFQTFYNLGQCNVPYGLNDAVAIAAGGYHSLALRANGMVLAWGAGTSTGSSTEFAYGQSLVPAGLSNVVAIAAGTYHSVALKSDGQVVVWGGQPGINTSLTNIPAAATNLVAVASANNFIVGLKGDGSVISWGQISTVSPGANTVSLGAGWSGQCLAVKADGSVTLTGGGFSPTAPLTNVVEAKAGQFQGLALKNDGTAQVWGNISLMTVYGLNRFPTGLTNVLEIGCGQDFSMVAFGDGSTVIKTQPPDRVVTSGGQTLLTVLAAGAGPLQFQWQFNATNLPAATNAWLTLGNFQSSNAGGYRVVVSGALGATTSRVANVALLSPSPSLAAALNDNRLPWTSGGNAKWFGQTNVTHDGTSAAQSGPILDSQQSYLRTSVAGPGGLGFWWKVSSEQWFDLLSFSIDNQVQASISGEVDWQFQQWAIPAGSHTLQWTYSKDPTTSDGADAGWVGDIVFVTAPPSILEPPVSQTVAMRDTIALSVTASGVAPLSYQWLKDGANLPGATLSGLLITNATRRSSGDYSVAVTDLGGTAVSTDALVLVRVPQKLANPLWQPDGVFTLLSGDADGGFLLPGDLHGFQALTSTNLLDWSVLSGSLALTNGSLLLVDPAATNSGQRFYRILEQ